MKTDERLSRVIIIDEKAAGAISSLLDYTYDFFRKQMPGKKENGSMQSVNPAEEKIGSMISDIENLLSISEHGMVQAVPFKKNPVM